MADSSVIQNTSYTNKDFNSIYTEMLDLVKKLTSKWDPSISNESDPGVILLKLNALIADKNNYNIDKNVLECFPSSVTQNGNARELFEQLGYTMKGNISAITAVSIRWAGDIVQDGLLTIPVFSMVTDSNTEYVYTLLGSIDPSLFSDLNPSSSTITEYIGDIKVPKDGSIITVLAMQGVANEYNIEGKTLITLQDIDSNNRLYFSGYNVANNGIFIQNADNRDSTQKMKNFTEWRLVNNLASQNITDKVYKYGTLKNSTTSFIEFSNNISDVIGNGIYITFLSSSGSYGNIPVNTLNNFYSTVNAVDESSDPETNSIVTSTIQLSTSNMNITNPYAGIGGADPESIDSAYKNYTKTAGTFETLVTLRDYMNKIQTSKLVSNAIVTDRTCDIQDTVKIVQQKITGVEAPFVEVRKEQNTPLMNAFDLKLYLTQYVSAINAYSDFSRSFDLIPPSNKSYELVKSYVSESKCVQHDYKNIREYVNSDPNPCMFLNEFPLNIRIIPQYELTEIQKSEIKSNIVGALYENFNASMVEFGKEASYDDIYDVIQNSDNRIKTVILDDIQYETYAIILKNNDGVETFEKVLVSSLDKTNEETSTALRTDIYAKAVLSGSSSIFLPSGEFPYGLDQTYTVLQNNIKSIDGDTDIILTKDEDGFFYGNTRQNEILEFISPKLTQLVKYSQYVRYGCVGFDTDQKVTGTYTLTGEQKIGFFWKATDAGYNYEIIGAGSTIKTNVLLQNGPSQSVQDLIKDTDPGTGKMTDSQKVPTIDSIPASYILTEDSYISTQIVSSLTIGGSNQPTSNLYWITDTPDSEYYVLFDGDEYKRTLNEGEYFIYSNSAKTVYTIYGANTEIIRSKSKPDVSFSTWRVKRISLDKVLSGGIEAFEDSDWFILDGNNYSVKTEEITKQTIPSNTALKVEADPNITANNIHFTYDSIFSVDGSSTISNIPLSSLSISYSDAENPLLYNNSIDVVHISDTERTTSHAILVVDVSPENYMTLLDRQFITAHYEQKEIDGSLSNLTKRIPENENDAPLSMYSSYLVQSSLGHGINTTEIYYTGEEKKLTLYSFKSYTSSNSTGEGTVRYDYTTRNFYLDYNSTDLTIPYSIAYNIPADKNYILKYYIPNSSIADFSITNETNDGSIADVLSVRGKRDLLNTEGVHYVFLTMPNPGEKEGSYKITFNIKATGSGTVTVYPLFAYSKRKQKQSIADNDTFSLNGITYQKLPVDVSFNSVVKRMAVLNEYGKFDYTYVPQSDVYIDNPLAPESFNYENHYANKFTICKLKRMTQNNIVVSNRTR